MFIDKFLSRHNKKKEFVKGCRNIELMQKIVKRNLFVDADSCPVKEEVIRFTEEYNIKTVFVSSYAHIVSNPNPLIEYITVDCEREEVDLYLMNHVQKEDVVITQDHALASILITRGAITLSPRGVEYTEGNISLLLDARHFSSKQRRAGNKTKGPKRFTKLDREQFCKTLRKIFLDEEGFC